MSGVSLGELLLIHFNTILVLIVNYFLKSCFSMYLPTCLLKVDRMNPIQLQYQAFEKKLGPSTTLSPSQNWNISYQIFYQDFQSPATTSFILICKENYHFVNQIERLTAVCGIDG